MEPQITDFSDVSRPLDFASHCTHRCACASGESKCRNLSVVESDLGSRNLRGHFHFFIQVYLVKKPVNFGPHFLVNESETR